MSSFLSHLQQQLSPKHIIAMSDIVPGTKVAELCCGHQGHFTFPLAEAIGTRGTLFAVDHDEHAVNSLRRECANRGLSHVQCVHANVSYPVPLPIVKQSCSHVFCINKLHSLSNIRAMLQHALGLLEQKGKLLLVDWDPHHVSYLGPLREARISPQLIQHLAQEFGGVHEHTFSPGLHWWGMVLHKR